MKSRLKILSAITILLLAVSFAFSCKCQRSSGASEQSMTDITSVYDPERTQSEIYYEAAKDTADVDWREYIPVFHYWRNIENEDYLFDVPTPEQIAAWESLCEKETPADSVMRCYVQEYCLNMNQFMTIQDFMNIWPLQEPYGSDDAFTEWRLEQYYLDIYNPDSEYDRFMYLRDAIQSLCSYDAQSQFELNFKAGMEATLEEFYCRMMRREAVHHSTARVAKALEKESLAWETYHNQLDSTFRVLDSENGMASAWSMAISGILFDDAETRRISLDDFYFALTDSLDYEIRHKRSRISEYEIHHYTKMPEGKVLQEYKSFINILKESDIEYASPLSERKKALEDEMKAWEKWIQSRKAVSSILTGFVKDAYDNSTNTVIRAKFIMLKNRYQGYGLTSNDVMECLIPYDASDEEMSGPSFDVRWDEKYHTSWW